MNLFDLCVYKNLNKESGGDVDVSSLVATENKTYNAGEGKAYNPVVVNVPTPPPSLQSLTASHNGYFLPSSGYVGFSEVNVDVALPQNAYLLESQKDDVVTIQHGAEFDMPKLIASIEPQQSGSGDPSPENVRPISGWTACNVTRSGANLFDKTTITENKIINNNTGEETTSYDRFSSDYIKVNSSTDYYASNVIKPAQWYCAFYYDKNKNYLSCGELSSTGDTASGVITTPSNCNYVRLVGVTTYKDDVSFVAGNQAPTSYEPYSGNTYTINFVDGSSPLTVYGGTLNVLTGLLTVDRIKTSMPAYWAVNAESSMYWLITHAINDVISVENTDTSIRVISDGFKGVSANEMITKMATTDNINSIALISSKRLFLKVSKADYPTLNDLYSMIQTNNLQVIYELATPQTYQLTPTQVVKSLLGVNNIWADTGEVDVQIWTKEVTS